MRPKNTESFDRDRLTKPLISFMNEEETEDWESKTSIIREENEDLVEAHKQAFGKRSYCWRGSKRRYWVWELSGYRVYVSKKGVSLEVETHMNKEEALEKANEYLSNWKNEDL